MTAEQENTPHEDPPPTDAGKPVSGGGLPLSRREFIGTTAAAAAGALAVGSGLGTAAAETLTRSALQRSPSKKVIVQAMGLDIDLLDPHYFKTIPGYYAVCNLYDMMLDYEFTRQPDGGLYPVADQHGNWKMKPWLAESWNVSRDQKTLTFKLRKGLKFSDGRPLTAHDVKSTWDRAAGVAGYGQLIMNMITINHTSQMTVHDEYTVVLHLNKPNPFAMKMLSVNVLGIMNAHALQAHATKSDPTAHKWLDTHAAGSGAYILANWTPGVSWELKPNPHSWNPAALKNAGTLVRTIPNASERYNLLVKGDVDVAYDLLPKDLATLRHNPNVRLIQFKVPWPYFLGMNNTMPPFDNKTVRQAMAYAIPQKTLVDKVLYGFARECKSPVAAGMPTSDFGLSPYQTSVAKTKQLLQQAGVSNLKFDLAVQEGRPQDAQAAVWIQATLAQAGVQVNIVQMNVAEYFAKQAKKQLQAFISEFYSWVNDPFYHLFWNFDSQATATNVVGYHNPTVDALIAKGIYSTNPSKRVLWSRQAQKIIIDDAAWALLYQINYTIAVRKNIHDFNWYPDVGTRFLKVYKS
jgi:peptide/nickel transport system substrate-binding protein